MKTTDELNQISEGLGDKICSEIRSISINTSFLEIKERIGEMLNSVNLGTKDVVLSHSFASGMTIQEAFDQAMEWFEFKDKYG